MHQNNYLMTKAGVFLVSQVASQECGSFLLAVALFDTDYLLYKICNLLILILHP